MGVNDVSPRTALNALNSMVEKHNRGHVQWAIIGRHMVICLSVDLPIRAFEFWLDGKPISMRALAEHFGIVLPE